MRQRGMHNRCCQNVKRYGYKLRVIEIHEQDYLSSDTCVVLFVVNAPESDRRDLLSELELMKRLKPHPHVIKLMGYVTETGKGNADNLTEITLTAMIRLSTLLRTSASFF